MEGPDKMFHVSFHSDMTAKCLRNVLVMITMQIGAPQRLILKESQLKETGESAGPCVQKKV